MVNSSLISASASAFSREEEDNLLFPSLSAHDVVHPPMPQGGGKARTARRRRKKASGLDGSDGKKRRLSDEQVKLLEKRFGEEKKLEVGRKVHLATELGLDPKQVAVWFQNRRARHKSKQVEEAYLKLKAAHEATILEKCHLENEVLNLKDRLLAAQEEIKKLSLGATGATGGSEFVGSPSSSSLTYQPLGAHRLQASEEEGELMCMQEYNFNDYYMMEYLANFYGV